MLKTFQISVVRGWSWGFSNLHHELIVSACDPALPGKKHLVDKQLINWWTEQILELQKIFLRFFAELHDR